MKNDQKSKISKKSRKSLGRGGKRPGAGRPGLARETAKLQVMVPAELAERLASQAEAAGLRLPEHLRAILERAAG